MTDVRIAAGASLSNSASPMPASAAAGKRSGPLQVRMTVGSAMGRGVTSGVGAAVAGRGSAVANPGGVGSIEAGAPDGRATPQPMTSTIVTETTAMRVSTTAT